MKQNYQTDIIRNAAVTSAELMLGHPLHFVPTCGVISIPINDDSKFLDVAHALYAIQKSTGVPCSFQQLRVTFDADEGEAQIRLPQCIEDAGQKPEHYSGLIQAFTDSDGQPTHWDAFPSDCANCDWSGGCEFSDQEV
ncbi:MAG: hypothetical protein HOH43_02555 [Candidatus Latescibacteria bacterium]|nr:hypothetical protein [Candidatus Latescibacterota bacterium]